jgi:hypothetical protein
MNTFFQTRRPSPRTRRLGLAAILCLPLSALSQPSMLYILDGSGSMWGRVGGEPKITAAKGVLKELISETPDDIQVGLMAYGHRRKGDCQDIELLTAPGGDRSLMQQRVQTINPKGKTPIGDALLKAGERLADNEDPTTLVLVSDGLETCGGDPCATAGALREKGHKLVVHVVGLDVDQKATDQLQCIADVGGGCYFAAADAAGLRDALGQVKASVVEAKPLPAPLPPPKVEASKSNSKRIRIAGPGKIRLQPADWVKMPPNYWALRDVESGEDKGRNRDAQVRVKAGEYQIVWRQSEHGHSEVPLTAVPTVRSGETTEVPLSTGLRLTPPEGVPAPNWWGLAEPGADKPFVRVSRSLGPDLMPAGDYRLLWRQDEHGAATVDLGSVHIEDGKLNERVLDHGIVLQTADWMGEPRPYYYRLLDKGGKSVADWRIMGPQVAPPGDYRLVYRPSEHHHSEIPWGSVSIPEHGFAQVVMDSGIKFIPQADAKPPYRVYFIDLDDKLEIGMSNTWDPQPLPPGRYRMDWWQTEHGSRRETLVDELKVEPGTLLEIEI